MPAGSVTSAKPVVDDSVSCCAVGLVETSMKGALAEMSVDGLAGIWPETNAPDAPLVAQLSVTCVPGFTCAVEVETASTEAVRTSTAVRAVRVRFVASPIVSTYSTRLAGVTTMASAPRL